MAKEIVGKCFICKKEITRHDISHIEEGHDDPAAKYFKGWPGDGVLCTKHVGVVEEYDKEIEQFNKEIKINES